MFKDKIKKLRETHNVTQEELAKKVKVSRTAVSKWETGKGFPDIGIIEELSKALGISIAELLTGDFRENENRSANMKKINFYVCPICGNVMRTMSSILRQ